MLPIYATAPNPKWYFLDAQGAPAAGGFLYSYSAIDQSTPKFIFSDPAGMYPYPDPIVLDSTGGTPVPMYFDVSNTPTDPLYYIVVTDAAGNIIFDDTNFPNSGGGGVTPITSNVDIENNLVNGQFLFIDAVSEAESLVSPVPVGVTHMAQGSGFFKNTDGQYVPFITAGYESGWSFLKAGGVGATDAIQFVPVTTAAIAPPLAPTANATRYFQFTVSATGTGYTTAALQNIIPNVGLFQNETLTVSFDTQGTSAALSEFIIIQHFGTSATGPTPSSDISTAVAFTYSGTTWARQILTITLPNIMSKVKGTNQDDCLIIQWSMPLNVLGTFQLANLQVQRGTFGVAPYIEQTYAQDQYKVLMDILSYGNLLFRTGDLRHSTNENPIPGWILLNNDAETLGSALSGAGFAGNQYKNLYLLWWDSFFPSQCIVTGGRGVSALADFNANKSMTICQDLITTVIATAGNLINFATFEGERTVTLDATQLGNHVHGIRAITGANAGSSGSITTLDGVGAVLENTEPSPGGLPHNNMQPTIYLFLFVKL